MNSVNIHLALTHVPVMLSLIGLIMLVVAYIKKNISLTRTSYIILLVAGIAAIPVFVTGEESEDAVENLPGVSELIIERHEEVANLAMISITAAGLFALIALFSFKWQSVSLVLKKAVLLLAFASGGLMAQTAHLGGQIRHTEIRSGSVSQNFSEAGGENGGSHEEDDD